MTYYGNNVWNDIDFPILSSFYHIDNPWATDSSIENSQVKDLLLDLVFIFMWNGDRCYSYIDSIACIAIFNVLLTSRKIMEIKEKCL